jgi:hypothetical protein
MEAPHNGIAASAAEHPPATTVGLDPDGDSSRKRPKRKRRPKRKPFAKMTWEEKRQEEQRLLQLEQVRMGVQRVSCGCHRGCGAQIHGVSRYPALDIHGDRMMSGEQLPVGAEDRAMPHPHEDVPSQTSDAELAKRRRAALEATALDGESDEEEGSDVDDEVGLSSEGIDGSIIQLAPYAQAASQVFVGGEASDPTTVQLSSAGGLLPSDSPVSSSSALHDPFADPLEASEEPKEFQMKTRLDLIQEVLRLRGLVSVLEDRAKAAESEFSQLRERRASRGGQRPRGSSFSHQVPVRKRSRSCDETDVASEAKRVCGGESERELESIH